MKILNPTPGIVRISINDVDAETEDVTESEYLFAAGASVEVANSHVARVLREHAELEPKV